MQKTKAVFRDSVAGFLDDQWGRDENFDSTTNEAFFFVGILFGLGECARCAILCCAVWFEVGELCECLLIVRKQGRSLRTTGPLLEPWLEPCGTGSCHDAGSHTPRLDPTTEVGTMTVHHSVEEGEEKCGMTNNRQRLLRARENKI